MGQVLGPKLDKPARFLLPWTVDGGATGGTGQAIRIGHALGIPVLNLQRPAIRAAILQVLGIERERSVEQQRDRKRGVWGKSVSVRVARGGRRSIKKKHTQKTN